MIITVTHCGRICYNRQKLNFSAVFAGQKVCVKPKIFGPLILLGFSVVDSFFLQSSTVRIAPGSCQPMIHCGLMVLYSSSHC